MGCSGSKELLAFDRVTVDQMAQIIAGETVQCSKVPNEFFFHTEQGCFRVTGGFVFRLDGSAAHVKDWVGPSKQALIAYMISTDFYTRKTYLPKFAWRHNESDKKLVPVCHKTGKDFTVYRDFSQV